MTTTTPPLVPPSIPLARCCRPPHLAAAAADGSEEDGGTTTRRPEPHQQNVVFGQEALIPEKATDIALSAPPPTPLAFAASSNTLLTPFSKLVRDTPVTAAIRDESMLMSAGLTTGRFTDALGTFFACSAG